MIIDRALEIATTNLRMCYTRKGIYAGMHHFRNYWARDSCFASFGCLKIKDYDIVKKNLEMYLKKMIKSGQVPFRIGPHIPLNYLGIITKFRARYTNDKSTMRSVDQNSLVIISAYEYIKTTKDKKFLKKHIEKLEKIMLWNFRNDFNKDLLVEEHDYCNWADSMKKKGTVLYTNVCHCHALKCLSELYKMLKIKDMEKNYLDLHKKVKDKINSEFWSGEHYFDWFDRQKHYSYFSTDGNMLAILWDIADKEQAKKIEEAAHIFDINDIPSQCVHPDYTKNLVSPFIRFIGIPDYHNGMSWLWLGCINALAKEKLKMHKDAKDLVMKMAEIIVKHGYVYEVYEQTGDPIKRALYHAEYPFAWSSGLFIYSVKEIYKKK